MWENFFRVLNAAGEFLTFFGVFTVEGEMGGDGG
jgi:hypothetical protein